MTTSFTCISYIDHTIVHYLMGSLIMVPLLVVLLLAGVGLETDETEAAVAALRAFASVKEGIAAPPFVHLHHHY
jgi:hypothetical protein